MLPELIVMLVYISMHVSSCCLRDGIMQQLARCKRGRRGQGSAPAQLDYKWLQTEAYLQPVVLNGHCSLQDGIVAREVVQVAAQRLNLRFPKALHKQCTQMSVTAHLSSLTF